MRNRTRLLAIAALLLSTVGCDQVTKEIADHALRGAPARSFASGLVTLSYHRNPGAFLSLGAGLDGSRRFAAFTLGVAVFLGAVAVWLIRTRDLSRGELLGGSLLLAGGIGNLVDRVFRDGTVIDFLHLGTARLGTGIFNVADVAITAGVAVLAISFRRTREESGGKRGTFARTPPDS